jgi:hypothetical protein
MPNRLSARLAWVAAVTVNAKPTGLTTNNAAAGGNRPFQLLPAT